MDILSYKIVFVNKNIVNKEWVLVDVDGQILGCFVSEVVKMFCGKYKFNFIFYVDCGDNVVVINVVKINLIGKKWDVKIYVCYIGYFGG